MRLDDFAAGQPPLRLEQFFAGTARGAGLFEDRFGNLRRQFVVTIQGRVEGDALILDEDFRYADGEPQRRVWRLTRVGDNGWQGRADDVVGVATGRVAGNAFNLHYTLDLNVGGRVMRVNFDDWMWLQADGTLLNRSYVSWWGIEIGTVTLSFRRAAAAGA